MTDPYNCNFNWKQDNGESGIDCGGGQCPPCPVNGNLNCPAGQTSSFMIDSCAFALGPANDPAYDPENPCDPKYRVNIECNAISNSQRCETVGGLFNFTWHDAVATGEANCSAPKCVADQTTEPAKGSLFCELAPLERIPLPARRLSTGTKTEGEVCAGSDAAIADKDCGSDLVCRRCAPADPACLNMPCLCVRDHTTTSFNSTTSLSYNYSMRYTDPCAPATPEGDGSGASTSGCWADKEEHDPAKQDECKAFTDPCDCENNGCEAREGAGEFAMRDIGAPCACNGICKSGFCGRKDKNAAWQCLTDPSSTQHNNVLICEEMCRPCPKNTYQRGNACITCPQDKPTTRGKDGQTALGCFACNEGESFSSAQNPANSVCKPCTSNFYGKNSVCIPCPDDKPTTRGKDGQTQCFACSNDGAIFDDKEGLCRCPFGYEHNAMRSQCNMSDGLITLIVGFVIAAIAGAVVRIKYRKAVSKWFSKNFDKAKGKYYLTIPLMVAVLGTYDVVGDIVFLTSFQNEAWSTYSQILFYSIITKETIKMFALISTLFASWFRKPDVSYLHFEQHSNKNFT